MELSEADIGKFSHAVQQMVEYFELMEGVAVDEDRENLRHARNILREDVAGKSLICDDILGQVPELEDRLIVIPNVL